MNLPRNRLASSGVVDIHTERIGFAFATKNRTLRCISLVGTITSPQVSVASGDSTRGDPDSSGNSTGDPLPSAVRSGPEPPLENVGDLACITSLD